MNKVLNEWPSTQLCMECKHGQFVMGDNIPDSSYMCSEGVSLGPCDSSCDSFEGEGKPPVQDNRFLANDPIDW